MTADAGNGVDALLEDMTRRWAASADESPHAAADFADTLLETLATVLKERRDACYVSTPITTGPEFVAWWRSQGSSIPRHDPAYEAELSQVVQRNIEAVRPLVAAVETRFRRPVIDPTRLGPIAGWQQPDYHRFWVRVIRTFVDTVVFADGWQYSSGCSVEFAATVGNGLSSYDASIRVLDVETGVRLLEAAADELDAAGLGSEYQRRAVEEIRQADHSREAS